MGFGKPAEVYGGMFLPWELLLIYARRLRHDPISPSHPAADKEVSAWLLIKREFLYPMTASPASMPKKRLSELAQSESKRY